MAVLCFVLKDMLQKVVASSCLHFCKGLEQLGLPILRVYQTLFCRSLITSIYLLFHVIGSFQVIPGTD